MKRTTIITGIALALLLANAGAAHARAGSDASLEESGKLVAVGVGSVELHGAGFVRVDMSGDVTIIDEAGDAEITIEPANTATDASSYPAAAAAEITLTGFSGRISVNGSGFAVIADGKFRRLVAWGTGSAFLEGWGWYRASGSHFGVWSPAGVQIDYEPPR